MYDINLFEKPVLDFLTMAEEPVPARELYMGEGERSVPALFDQFMETERLTLHDIAPTEFDTWKAAGARLAEMRQSMPLPSMEHMQPQLRDALTADVGLGKTVDVKFAMLNWAVSNCVLQLQAKGFVKRGFDDDKLTFEMTEDGKTYLRAFLSKEVSV